MLFLGIQPHIKLLWIAALRVSSEFGSEVATHKEASIATKIAAENKRGEELFSKWLILKELEAGSARCHNKPKSLFRVILLQALCGLGLSRLPARLSQDFELYNVLVVAYGAVEVSSVSAGLAERRDLQIESQYSSS